MKWAVATCRGENDRVTEPLLDQRVYPLQQRPALCLHWYLALAVEPAGESDREQVEDGPAQTCAA